MKFRITENRIGAPTLFETDNGQEAMAFYITLFSFRLYRDGKNIAVGFMQNNLLTMRSDDVEFPTFESHFA